MGTYNVDAIYICICTTDNSLVAFSKPVGYVSVVTWLRLSEAPGLCGVSWGSPAGDTKSDRQQETPGKWTQQEGKHSLMGLVQYKDAMLPVQDIIFWRYTYLNKVSFTVDSKYIF